MFGTKQGKAERLEHLATLVEQQPEQLTPKDLAKQLGVARTTIEDDLATLEGNGVLLAEDHRARLSLFQRIFGNK